MRRIMGVVFLVLLSPGVVDGHQLDDPVETGREALSSRTRFPWYDRQADDVRAVPVAARSAEAAHRGSSWETGPREARKSSIGFGGFRDVLRVVAWIVLGLLIVALIAIVIWVFLRVDSPAGRRAASSKGEQGASSEVDRVEQLPFDVTPPETDLLSEARRYYEAGDYSKAIIYYFSYQLVQLDEHQRIRLARGKTNRQYLREVHTQPVLREITEITMVAFEDVFFGNHALNRERFERCWNRLDDFRQQLQQVGT